MTTYVIDFMPLQLTLTPDSASLDNGQQTKITVYVTANDAPILGATVHFTSDNGGTFTTTKEQGNGYYTTNFTATSFTKATTCTITAAASKTGYANSQATTQITVQPPDSTLNFKLRRLELNSNLNLSVNSQLENTAASPR